MNRSGSRAMRVGMWFLVCGIAGGFFIANEARAGLGISPPYVHATHLVKGARYSSVLYIVQGQPDEDLKIKADIELPARVRPWVTLDTGLEFTIPKGTRQFPVGVTVQVPPDVELGNYNGRVVFTSSPGQAGQVTIALAVQASIAIVVGNDTFEDFGASLRHLDIEEGWDPRVYVRFDNRGNIPEAFSGASYELYDQFNSVRLAFVQKNADFPETLPFVSKEYTVEFPINFNLSIGQYWGTVSFYKNDKLIASQKGVFSVLKRGSLANSSASILGFIRTYWMYETIILVLAIFAYGVFLRKRRRARSLYL
ncbi:MAG: hypothetical protein A2122_02400 [Candidatus Liptonbacteria bacterium GWB1_49_6]|uniref:Uncharacterized protein n=1 Tax=Candidatus Liptonbacteria bacterium GWB1_49_6 TaxID=1798644 RepID=A0A1G2C6E3_9BACT|nr:MAG: hypothetical protein A2122_02400 [Candidatus Liptonbacteria bacterium GWB1_49_6]